MNGLTRIFLVLLRLAIGWHFFFEGVEKIRSVDLVGPTESKRPWSSIGYLREANGPAANLFKKQVGDPDQEALDLFAVKQLERGQDPAQVPPGKRVSPALDQAWTEYLQRFEAKYELPEEQRQLAEAKMDQAKERAVLWLLGQGGKDSLLEVEKSFNGTAPVKLQENSRERLEEYRSKVMQLRDIMNEKLPSFGRDVEKQRIPALKSEISQLRTELLTALQKPMEESLNSVLTDSQKKMGPVSQPHSAAVQNWREWNRLDWIDGITRYAILAIGACLLLGLFTRTACLAGAGFLLLTYLALPAFPWLPESPRSEGSYLFVNKNVIEMLALLVLATTASGRWAGLDGLLRALMPWRWQRRAAADRLTPARRVTISR
ncbi:MAG TPA: DoxX family protein [Gemmataceae bacterium]|jgi:uncharacterized membrane protein YphA (DoxX/SURF4 family)|nr:DoxX family protein [Gemmataceae bacterium]